MKAKAPAEVALSEAVGRQRAGELIQAIAICAPSLNGRLRRPARQAGTNLKRACFLAENRTRKKMISTKITPDRSKIIIEREDHVKYWTRHFGVTKDELTRAIETVGNSAAAVRKQLDTPKSPAT